MFISAIRLLTIKHVVSKLIFDISFNMNVMLSSDGFNRDEASSMFGFFGRPPLVDFLRMTRDRL